MAIIGGIIGYYLSSYIGGSMVCLLAFAAGGFIYIAASNLVPELRKEVNSRESMASFGILLFGFAFVVLVKLYFSH